MPASCFVPKCQSGIPKHGQEKCSMFFAPKDPELLEKWRSAIPRRDRELRPSLDAICEKHFTPDCVLKYYTHNVLGHEVKIERGRPSLVPNSIPTIFPNCPPYFTRSRNNKKRKSSIKKESSPPKKPKQRRKEKEVCFVNPSECDLELDDSIFKPELDDSVPVLELEDSAPQQLDDSGFEDHEWQSLRQFVLQLAIPSRWTVCVIEEEKTVAILHWQRYAENLINDKKIFINCDLSVKIYLGSVNRPVPVRKCERVQHLDMIPELINIVNDIAPV